VDHQYPHGCAAQVSPAQVLGAYHGVVVPDLIW
jgi:hypothetical protein